ncbi:MAG: hypothetical protein AB9903_08545 [Vulcanimicrobiota bacterium]
MGTPDFSPPEQYVTCQSDEHSDIYALGATLYYLLTKTDMVKHSKKMPSLSTSSSVVPYWFEALIMKCLSVNTGERYQSVRMLEKDLQMRIFSADPNQEKLHAAMSQPLSLSSVPWKIPHTLPRNRHARI